MRMWMLDPKILCRRHLLGEHGELHKFLNDWIHRRSITGRIAGNAMEPLSYKARHDALAQEMVTRGYHHQSPLHQPDFSYLPIEQQAYCINRWRNLRLLLRRCSECRQRAHAVYATRPTTASSKVVFNDIY